MKLPAKLPRFGWSSGHRRVVLGGITLVATFLIIDRFRQPVVISDPPAAGYRVDDVVSKLDPNTASAADLSSIPSLGEKRAAEIVAYRDDLRRRHPNSIAFKQAKDLLALKGIGPSTVQNMEPYLVFPK